MKKKTMNHQPSLLIYPGSKIFYACLFLSNLILFIHPFITPSVSSTYINFLQSDDKSEYNKKGENQRYDRDISSLDRIIFKKIDLTQEKLQENSNLITTKKKKLFSRVANPKYANVDSSSSSPTLEIYFTCTSDDTTLCSKAQQAYLNAAGIIAGMLNLKQSINVDASFVSFCSQGECQNNVLGQATAASFWSLNPTNVNIDENYWYPQSLAKQLSDETLQWSEFDIVAQVIIISFLLFF